MKLHAFVAMPFGCKPGLDSDNALIDFNHIYVELIRPALEEADCVVFRADEELRAGDIRIDMFQELLIADLVVADLTIDNPNVWYELGVRHALCARGVVLVQGPRPTQPFDSYTDRKLNYTLKNGRLDPNTLAVERKQLAAMARETLQSSTARKISPVYVLLSHLREPQWRELLLTKENELSEIYHKWAERLEVARQKNRVSDILVLAGETPTRALALEAKRTAGNCLISLQHFDFALEQFEAALTIDPQDKTSQHKKAICLGRLGKIEEARQWIRYLTARDNSKNFKDPEICALAGRVEKEGWIQRWRFPGYTLTQMYKAATDASARLKEAIQYYGEAFVAEPAHYYSGINALTLKLLLQHLGGATDTATLDELTGGVRWAIGTALQRDKADYWARISYAELCLLLNKKESVARAYKDAMVVANRDWFALDSSRQTLQLFADLSFHPEKTAVALNIIEAELQHATPSITVNKVLLFSGHMMDTPDRPELRFPADMKAAAAERIAKALDAINAGKDDLALCQGAAGGDLLFLEACVQRGVRCQLLQPFAEAEFIQRSILPSTHGEDWCKRYYQLKNALADLPLSMPNELGPLPKGINPYERCNLWLLYTALALGVDKVHFFCLWNGESGDGPGGTAHMYNEVKNRTGRIVHIDTREL